MRISHDDIGTWLKEYKFTKTNGLVKRHYLDDATFLVLSIKVKRDFIQDGENNIPILKFTVEDKPLEDISIYFGQQLSAHKNLSLLKKFYFDYDLSINKVKEYNSEFIGENAGGPTQIFRTYINEDVADFLYRNNITSSEFPQVTIIPIDSFYDLYFGYSYVKDPRTTYDSISDYDIIVSEQLAVVDTSCFTWVKLVDNYYETEPSFKKSSKMLVDYRLDIKSDVITDWITDNFNSIFDNICGNMGTETNELDFNFMLYPPTSTGMQFEDVPTIISPSLLNSNKVIPSVIFEVKKSIVKDAQKYFVIDFLDLDTGLSIYSDNSYTSPTNFKLALKTGNTYPISFPLETSIFEKLTEIDYPDTKFKVTYTLPVEVSGFLANNLNYKIVIKVSDLTSERS